MFIRKIITITWCALTGGTPVYVKKRWRTRSGNGYEYEDSTKVKIKVSRRKFDPFDIDNSFWVKESKGLLELDLSGKVKDSSGFEGRWMYVNRSKQVEMILKKS